VVSAVDIQGLRDLGLLVTDAQGGAAVINGRGWTAIPEPLADLVRRALGDPSA